MKDTLFILKAPFGDGGFDWYCNDCATMEGALIANPHWLQRIEVRRIAFPRPRIELIELIGEEHQGCPVLVTSAERAPSDAVRVGEYAILTDVRAIGRALAHRHGGAGPHP
jgi:Protein of unknown function (DUF3088)